MINEIILLLIVMGTVYLGVINLAYFLFNPFFDNKIKYWSIYYLSFDISNTNKNE